MKIGLLTFTSNNYGTCLQAYAIKKALESMNHQVTFLYHHNRETHKTSSKAPKLLIRVLSILKWRSILRVWARLIYGKQQDTIKVLRIHKFEDFISSYLLTSKVEFNCIKDLESSMQYSFDAVVCGSDMIWSSEFANYFDIYQLKWFDKGKKISYAPSIGNVDFSEEEKTTSINNLSLFDNISCREKSGSVFLSELLNREVKEVLDPTLLFSNKEWLDFFDLPCITTYKPYILVYCFGGISDRRKKELQKKAMKDKIDVRYILSPDIFNTIHEKRYGDGAYGPIEFIKLFSNAAFTVVNGYHGLLFSIIFEKPFVVLHREKSEHWSIHENRMDEVLNKYSLSNRYLHDTESINSDFYTLDYCYINQLLGRERESSWEYLRDSLYCEKNA